MIVDERFRSQCRTLAAQSIELDEYVVGEERMTLSSSWGKLWRQELSSSSIDRYMVVICWKAGEQLMVYVDMNPGSGALAQP